MGAANMQWKVLLDTRWFPRTQLNTVRSDNWSNRANKSLRLHREIKYVKAK